MIDHQTARAQIKSLFAAAMLAGAPELSLFYDDEPKDAPDAGRGALNVIGSWVRLNIRHEDRFMAAFTPETRKRYTATGTVTAQIFSPRGDGLKVGGDAAMVVRNAFEGQDTPGGIEFKNVRIREVGPSGTWYQINVLADFTYDEMR